MKILQPEGWQRPSGYSNGIEVDSGQLVFISGLVGWDESNVIQSDCLVDQLRQVLRNTKAIMAEGGAHPEHIVRMTWYITDKQAYLTNLKAIGDVYRDEMGKNYPTMACVVVSSLVEDAAKIEIETTCVIPRKSLVA